MLAVDVIEDVLEREAISLHPGEISDYDPLLDFIGELDSHGGRA